MEMIIRRFLKGRRLARDEGNKEQRLRVGVCRGIGSQTCCSERTCAEHFWEGTGQNASEAFKKHLLNQQFEFQ